MVPEEAAAEEHARDGTERQWRSTRADPHGVPIIAFIEPLVPDIERIERIERIEPIPRSPIMYAKGSQPLPTVDGAPERAPLRAGVVGSHSKHHVAAVRALPDVELIGVVGDQAADTTVFDTLEELVAAGANVIHVLTPSAEITRQALELGCDVLLDKSAEDEAEARAICELARTKGRTVGIHHALQSDPQLLRALETARSGDLGEILAVDLTRSTDYLAFAGGVLPPAYRDAGFPFRDLGVRCLYLIQELLGPIEDVEASWSSLGNNRDLAFDEWSAVVRCSRGVGRFQLHFNAKRDENEMFIHGSEKLLRVHGHRSLLDIFRRRSQAAHVRDRVAELYRCLAAGASPAVTIDDAVSATHWAAKVARAAEADHARRLARFPLSERVPYVVTGASGRLGKAIVDRLRERGEHVRAFVRRIPDAPLDGVEYAFGNLGDPIAVGRALAGAGVVIHAGAAMEGDRREFEAATVVGTHNVIDACLAHDVKQLVHVSSLSVIDFAHAELVDETSPTEPRSRERGVYTQTKLDAEQQVRHAASHGLPCVILRPGQIFGGGIPLINRAVARAAAGRWLVLGDGSVELPLVYIDDVVDGVLAAVDKRLVGGEVIQLVDPEVMTQAQVLGVAADRPMLAIPRSIVFALGRLSEIPMKLLERVSPIAEYRLRSALAKVVYHSERARKLLDWAPRIGIREGIRRVTI